MAIITKLQRAKKFLGNSFCRKNMREAKQMAHRQYRRCAKQAVHCGKEINEKPRLTWWDLV